MASRRLQGDWPDRHGMGAIGPRDNRAPGPMLGRLARTSREAQAQCRGGDWPFVDYKAPGPIDLATRLQRGCTAGRGDWPHANGRAPGPPTQHGAIGPQRKKHARPESEAPTQSAPRRQPTGSRAPSPSGTARERGAPAEPGARPEPHGDPTGSGGGTRQQAQQEAQTRKPHTASTARPAQPEAHTAPQAATRTTSSTQRTARSTAGRAHTGHTPQETPHTPASKASTTRKQARQARPGPTNGATHRKHTRGHTEPSTPQTPASTTHARKADTRGQTNTKAHRRQTAPRHHGTRSTPAHAAAAATARHDNDRPTTTAGREQPTTEVHAPQNSITPKSRGALDKQKPASRTAGTSRSRKRSPPSPRALPRGGGGSMAKSATPHLSAAPLHRVAQGGAPSPPSAALTGAPRKICDRSQRGASAPNILARCEPTKSADPVGVWKTLFRRRVASVVSSSSPSSSPSPSSPRRLRQSSSPSPPVSFPWALLLKRAGQSDIEQRRS